MAVRQKQVFSFLDTLNTNQGHGTHVVNYELRFGLSSVLLEAVQLLRRMFEPGGVEFCCVLLVVVRRFLTLWILWEPLDTNTRNRNENNSCSHMASACLFDKKPGRAGKYSVCLTSLWGVQQLIFVDYMATVRVEFVSRFFKWPAFPHVTSRDPARKSTNITLLNFEAAATSENLILPITNWAKSQMTNREPNHVQKTCVKLCINEVKKIEIKFNFLRNTIFLCINYTQLVRHAAQQKIKLNLETRRARCEQAHTVQTISA